MPDIKREIMEVNKKTIGDNIYTIRGQKVMLDFALAAVYGYETKNLNRQVKNNIDKFDEDFMFQLTKEEIENLRCKNFTSNWGGSRYLPYAFTEQGIYMLMTILKGDLAIKQSKALIHLFKDMKDYIIENQDLIGQREITQLAVQTNQNTRDIVEIITTMATKDDLKKVMDNFIDPDTYKHFLILDGQKIEAEAAYSKIYKSAKNTVNVVDNYIGRKTLELLRAVKKGVKITIFSDNKGGRNLTASTFNDFLREYPNIVIDLKRTQGRYHDRYIVIDYGTEKESVYHCGASSKDAGAYITTISKVDDTSLYKSMISELLKNPNLILK